MRARLKHVYLAMLLAALAARTAAAATVGERHLVAHEASAALRNASHSDDLRITVWYPAAPDAAEAPLDVGPPGNPLFTPGSAAPDAAFEDTRPRPACFRMDSAGWRGSWRGSERLWRGMAMSSSPSTIPATTRATR